MFLFSFLLFVFLKLQSHPQMSSQLPVVQFQKARILLGVY